MVSKARRTSKELMMTSSKITISSLLVLLALLTITEGIEPHCRCIKTESRPIGHHIKKVEIIPAHSHCEDTEIIATLKRTGQEICLDPEATWVKTAIERMMSRNTIRVSITIRRISLRALGMELRCRCIQMESRPIGRHIEKVEIIPANSHCEDSEIIATLKRTGQEICLDPEATWVKRVIERMMSSRRR
ncbi:hypothetical protein CRUP_022385 [Coryphaenoides rupestris]|nr:hypothetical protein CRUP_022385 [Coryphaenoides rupestris]